MKQKTAKGLGLYFLFSFGLAWLCQVYGCLALLQQGDAVRYQLALTLTMFCPLAAVLAVRLVEHEPTGIGWKLRRGLKGWLAAWFGPVCFTLAGAALYFVLFPHRLDLSGSWLAAAYGGEWTAQTLQSELGITTQSYLLQNLLLAVTVGPVANAIPALGEEAGWRGYMMPRLKAALGVWKANVMGGIVWGVWHFPLMLLVGYEYGTHYLGAPWLGLVVWCVVCIALGTLLDLLYERTGCIWVPAVAHGAFNAIAALPTVLTYPADSYYNVLGPMPIGLISALPLIAAAAWVLWKSVKKA